MGGGLIIAIVMVPVIIIEEISINTVFIVSQNKNRPLSEGGYRLIKLPAFHLTTPTERGSRKRAMVMDMVVS